MYMKLDKSDATVVTYAHMHAAGMPMVACDLQTLIVQIFQLYGGELGKLGTRAEDVHAIRTWVNRKYATANDTQGKEAREEALDAFYANHFIVSRFVAARRDAHVPCQNAACCVKSILVWPERTTSRFFGRTLEKNGQTFLPPLPSPGAAKTLSAVVAQKNAARDIQLMQEVNQRPSFIEPLAGKRKRDDDEILGAKKVAYKNMAYFLQVHTIGYTLAKKLHGENGDYMLWVKIKFSKELTFKVEGTERAFALFADKRPLMLSLQRIEMALNTDILHLTYVNQINLLIMETLQLMVKAKGVRVQMAAVEKEIEESQKKLATLQKSLLE